MATPTLKDRSTLAQEFVRRFLTYTDQITYFGNNAIVAAFASGLGGLVQGAYLLYVALLRRLTYLAGQGDPLTDRAAEDGAQRLGPMQSKMFVVARPVQTTVTAITNAGANDKVEVADSTGIAAGMSIRVRNGNGTVTDIRTISSISVGTGPHGGDELVVPALTGSYSPGSDTVAVLTRITIVTGTRLTTTAGIAFDTLATLVTGDSNPIMDGESTSLGLADKVWCEATTTGAATNVDPLSVTGFQSGPINGILDVFNPEPATGGEDEESDLALKYRGTHRSSMANQETLAWLEAVAVDANLNVLRAVKATSSSVGVMAALALKRNGGIFSTAQLTAIEGYLNARVRSQLTTSVDNISMTAVQVEGQITINADADFRTVWKTASQSYVAYLDFRKWAFGGTVDNSELLTILRSTPGVASLDVPTFLPAAPVSVGATSLPTFAGLSLKNLTTAETINAALAENF